MSRGLLARRVPQLTGMYLAALWGCVEFTDWAVNQFSLAPAVTTLVVITLLLLLPAVLVLAWRHGAPGADQWTKVDGAVIGLNLTAAAGILYVIFGGQVLGAATTVKLVEDLEGNTVERVVPKAAFRRDVLLFDFDNESGDSDLDWFGTGIMLGVNMDLAQDLFMSVVTIDDATVQERLAEAGFSLGDRIPLSLKREVADRRSLKNFMTGTVRMDGDGLVVETHLYDTRTAREIASNSYRGTDPLDLSDLISVDLRHDLGIPDWQVEESVDLPAAELATHSPAAFELLVRMQSAARSNDLAEARSLAGQAAALDSTFALAHLSASILALVSGDQAAAGSLMDEANQHAYRLPERLRLSIRVIDQWLFKQDPEAAVRAAHYWTEIYPQDTDARRQLAGILQATGNMDEALVQYRALLAIDSTDVTTMRAAASVFRQLEEFDSTFAYYKKVADRQPNDVQTRVEVAGTLTILGRYSEAREELEQARVAAPEDASISTEIGFLDLREGRYEEAIGRIAQVAELERTPSERERRAGLQETLAFQTGRFALLEDAYRRRLATLAEFAAPINVIGSIDNSEFLVYAHEWGREAVALEQLDSLRNSIEAPFNLQLDAPTLRINLAVGDIESARESLANLQSLMASLGTSRGGNAMIAWGEARITELEDGNCRRAIDGYDAAQALVPLEPGYHAARLNCLTSLERWDDAEQEADWIFTRFAGVGTRRLMLARYHAARGQTAAAISHLEAALGFWSEADAEYIPAQEARALLAELQGA